MPSLPTGVVTFLFSDIEGSTRLLKSLGRERYAGLLEEHARLLREAFSSAGGQVFGTEGDALFVAFGGARQAISGAIAAQRALAENDWGDRPEPKVRMGIHTGEASISEEGQYYGVSVHRAARICAAAHGGQVLISHATQALLSDEEDEEPRFILHDLGPQRLKDLEQPLRLYQLLVEGLPTRFPAPRTLNRRWRQPVRQRRVQLAALVLVLAGAGAGAAVLLTSGSSSGRAAPPTTKRHTPRSRPAGTTIAELLAPSLRQRIHAVLSPYDFFPAAPAPAGMILDGRANLDESPSSLPRVCGAVFTASYAAPGGRRMVWSTSRDCNSGGVTACHQDGYPGYSFGLPADRQAIINHRRVFFSNGNEGANAWACIRLKVNGFADVAVAGLWQNHFLTPRQAMMIVAHARPIQA